jgi:hypothetical protein
MEPDIGGFVTRNNLPFAKSVGKSSSKACRVPFIICWKSIISKLVGEDSLTGFLFVYAPNGVIW